MFVKSYRWKKGKVIQKILLYDRLLLGIQTAQAYAKSNLNLKLIPKVKTQKIDKQRFIVKICEI